MRINPDIRLRRDHALTLIEVMVVVVCLLVIGVFLMYYLVRGTTPRSRPPIMQCAYNLKQIALAYKVFSNDHDDKFPFRVTNSLAFGNTSRTWLHFQAMSNELGSARILVCPGDHERLPNLRLDFGLAASATASSLSAQGNAAVSYVAALDADETQPEVILTGDRHLETNRFNLAGRLFLAHTNGTRPAWTTNIHDGSGIIALSDGSAQQVTSSGLAYQIGQGQQSLDGTNRLLLPLLP